MADKSSPKYAARQFLRRGRDDALVDCSLLSEDKLKTVGESKLLDAGVCLISHLRRQHENSGDSETYRWEFRRLLPLRGVLFRFDPYRRRHLRARRAHRSRAG